MAFEQKTLQTLLMERNWDLVDILIKLTDWLRFVSFIWSCTSSWLEEKNYSWKKSSEHFLRLVLRRWLRIQVWRVWWVRWSQWGGWCIVNICIIYTYTYYILQKLFLFFPQKSRSCAGQRRLSTNVGSGTIPASTVKSVKQRWGFSRYLLPL